MRPENGLCAAALDSGAPFLTELAMPPLLLQRYLSYMKPGTISPPSMKARCRAKPAAVAAARSAKAWMGLMSTELTPSRAKVAFDAWPTR
ncbi:hypothetical protein D3C78_1187510 [compost metagenome]